MKTVIRKCVLVLLVMKLSMVCTHVALSTPPDDLMGRDLEKAKQMYQKAIRGGDDSFIIHYAEALFYAGRYDEAIDIYKQADELGLITTIYQKRNYVHAAAIEGKDSPYKQDTNYFLKNWELQAKINSFCSNTPAEDFAPFYWNNMLFITSSRQQANTRYDFTNKPFLNIHAFIHDCVPVGLPDFLPDNINTPTHDGPLAISEDGSMVVVTRNYPSPNTKGIYHLYLDYFLRENNSWSEVKRFPYVSIEYSVQHPFYHDADSLLYFSSNIPGGFGGFDLYTSKWNGNSWERPVNLGPEVNSEYDEVFPSVSPQGYLIYATNHIETMGGLDLVLFMSGNRYLFPEPFNTVFEDFAISFKDERSGYFSSNRNRMAFDDDIFVFSIQDDFLPYHNYFVEVFDEETMEPLQGVQVVFDSAKENIQSALSTDDEGRGFLYQGSAGKHEVVFDLTKTGYISKRLSSSDFSMREGDYIVTLFMAREPIPIDDPGREARQAGFFVVYFDNDHPNPRTIQTTTAFSYEQTFNNYLLRKTEFYNRSASSRAELDQFFADVEKGMEQLKWLASFIAEELKAGRRYTIVFTSHASPLANSSYNLALSKRRFVSVENFIRSWDGGSLVDFVDKGYLNYENNPYGSAQARIGISDDRNNPARSIFGVEASRERRVTISWKRNDAPESGIHMRTRIEESAVTEAPSVSEPVSRPLAETTLAERPETATPPAAEVNLPKVSEAVLTPVTNLEAEVEQDNLPIHIIVGSYPNRSDAEAMASSLQRQGAEAVKVIMPVDGSNYRVSYKAFRTMAEANRALPNIKKEVRADAWILRY